MEEGFTFTLPSGIDLEKLGLDENISVIIAPGSNLGNVRENVEYEQFLADVWVGIVLTLMVLVCVCCMCSCLLYHKFQQWKRSVMAPRTTATSQSTVEEGNAEAELPSYSIASGLPSYEEALEQLKKVKEPTTSTSTNRKGGAGTVPSVPAVRNKNSNEEWIPRTPPTPVHLSVPNLIRSYKLTRNLSNYNSGAEIEAKPT